ncbi:MAG TPA: IclR family transcriptional regulator C-terminal domain-containing protein, partial [Acidimicrobiales bacterium]|nr:IclR family transcriptional regulator C-terminal domain-containing protein [Acidimicrobiales bacterium]
GETVILVVIEHDRLRVLDVAESGHALRVSPPGPYLPLRHSSAARAIAAHLPADELAALREVDPSLTARTLSEVRRRGWAINDREIVADTRVVGAAVPYADGPPLAAVIIAAPTSRVGIDGLRRIGAHLAATLDATR